MKNYYKILGVRKSAKREDILNAYSKILKEFREKKEKNLVNRNNIILITEAFNIITDSSKRVKYDRDYQNYLDNKDEIDRNKKEERESKRKEREEKILEEKELKKREEEESKKEEEKSKKEEEESKKEEEESKKEEEKAKKEEEKAKKEEEEKAKKEEEEAKKRQKKKQKGSEKEKKNGKKIINTFFEDALVKIKELIKSKNLSSFVTGILITLLIVVIITRCGDEDNITNQPGFEDMTSQEDILNENNGTGNDDLNDQGSESDEVVEWYDIIDDDDVSEVEVEDTPSYPARGTVLRVTCDGTTKVRRIANGRGGFFFRRTENSSECGYVSVPSRGTIFKLNVCIGTKLVNRYHDGEGGVYDVIINEKSFQCGYEEPLIIVNRELRVRVLDKKGKLLKWRDGVRVHISKTKNISSSLDWFGQVTTIDLSKYPGAKYIIIKGGKGKKYCEQIKEIGNLDQMTFTCDEF